METNIENSKTITDQTVEPRETTFFFDLQRMITLAHKTHASEQSLLLKYIERYYTGGEICLVNEHRSALEAQTILAQLGYNYKKIDTQLPDDLVAQGYLLQDTAWENTDPYETAGGYIGGIALKGTPVKIFLTYSYTGFSLKANGDVNITRDHYNNNICGVSTGNDTETYEIGKRVETHTILHGNNFNCMWDKVHLTAMDHEKITDFIYSQK